VGVGTGPAGGRRAWIVACATLLSCGDPDEGPARGDARVTASAPDARTGGIDGGPAGGADAGRDAPTAPGAPAITSLAPAIATAGAVLPLTLTVDGTGFAATSIVRFNGEDRATRFVSPTRLAATIRTTDLRVSGHAAISVHTPGSGTSADAVLAIHSPAPRPTSLFPSSVPEGAGDLSLSVSGTGFLANSVVRWNGEDRPTTQPLPTGGLSATVTAGDLRQAGVAHVTVFNPPPGGGESAALTFLIRPAARLERASVASAGGEADGASQNPSISADGRVVAFESLATNLVPGDGNGLKDVFVRDRAAGVTSRASVPAGGGEANGASGEPSVNADGRFVAFVSGASNLVPGDTNGAADVFVRDLQEGTIERVSVSSDGAEAHGASGGPALTADGRRVAFWSHAADLVEGDGNALSDVFVRDRAGATTILASASATGAQGDHFSGLGGLTLSGDGAFAVFQTDASNLVAPGSGIVARGLATGAVAYVGSGRAPAASETGRFIAYQRRGPFIGDITEVYLEDTCAGATGCTPSSTKISIATIGGASFSGGAAPSVSADGRFVAFEAAGRMVEEDGNAFTDIVVRDTCRDAPPGCVARFVRLAPAGVDPDGFSLRVSLAAGARYAAFDSTATNLVAGDQNGAPDVFVAETTFPP
jgi:hypothetical protein